MVVFSAEGVVSKVKFLFATMFEETGLSALSDLRLIESRIIFVVGLKNCHSVASWSVKVERAVKSTCSIVLVGFLVMVGAVGTSSSTGLETTVRVIARLISANSSAVHILRML